jgi:cobalamin biosynthesis Mg chelatase CobN
MTNIKPHIRALLATAVLVAAFAIPAQSAFAAGNCSSGATASQYCQVKGVNTGSNDGNNNNNVGKTDSGNGPSNGNGPTTEAATAEGSTPVAVTPAAVETEAVESSSSSTLPFTGLDVGILALVAVALGGAGLLLRRLTASGAARS